MQRAFVAAAAAFGTLCLAAAVDVQAAPVTFQGSTLGAFNGGTVSASSALDGLSFVNSTFNASTSNDFVALGNSAGTGPGGSNVNNLGSMTLTGAAAEYTGDTFIVQLSFTSPTGIAGGNPADFTASILGSVSGVDQGGVFIDLDNSPRVFSFNDGIQAGTFTLVVNDVAVTANGTQVPITGYILTVIPEPSTAVLGGLGMLALAGRGRRAAR